MILPETEAPEVENPFAALDERADKRVPTATLQIYQHIDVELGRKENSTHINRGSSAGRCPKARWFQRNGIAAKPMAPRAIVNFLNGQLGEHAMQTFVEAGCVGPGKLYQCVVFGEKYGEIPFQNRTIKLYRQQDLKTDVGGIEFISHADGFGLLHDGTWELIEFKTSSDYGFDEFKTDGPGSYLKQAHVLMKSDKAQELGIAHVRFFYMRKSTGHMWDRRFGFDERIWQEVIEETKIANQEEMPATPYRPVEQKFRGKPTGKFVLPVMPCQYCGYKDKCFKFEVEFKDDQFGMSRPVYFVKKG